MCRSLYPVCLSLLNVDQPFRANTIQPVALIPSVKAHLARHCVALQLKVSPDELERAEHGTLHAVWQLIFQSIAKASTPENGVCSLCLAGSMDSSEEYSRDLCLASMRLSMFSVADIVIAWIHSPST